MIKKLKNKKILMLNVYWEQVRFLYVRNYLVLNTAQKSSFPLRISIVNGKLHFCAMKLDMFRPMSKNFEYIET